ncbi:unnamed protein product [Ambrosiozyma monospora]|uniref:Unnamed protein product n=1 Tax=Ambrosiozyma monospora TaxID=43982 RepID=A0A9W6TAE6_AMBMO|nr:unnamed protein product [Ambrosiozyma monospora]
MTTLPRLSQSRHPPVPEAVASNLKLKFALANSVGLKLFDPAVPTLIMTDASDLGIGGFIAQKLDKLWYPIAFISKSFTPTQRNYSTLQRELLGIVIALSNNYLLLSRDITVLTDHKALITIFNKTHILEL